MRRSTSLHSIDNLVERKISNDKYQAVVAVGDNINSVVSVADNIADVTAVATEVIPNIAEILIADDNAAIVTALYDLFDDRFLGAKAIVPTTDNDGNPLVIGAMYWNTVVSTLYIWDGTAWSAQIGETTAATLTNKTLDSITNYIGANHIHYAVRNSSGAEILAGTVVHASATQPGSDYLLIEPITNSQTQIALGILHATLANNASGLVINTGVCINIVDTSSWVAGTLLYPNDTGGLTSTKPTSGWYQACAVVTRQHATQGTMLVEFTEPKYIASTTRSGYVQLVDNLTTSDSTKALTATQGKAIIDSKGQPLGITPLNAVGQIDAMYLPSYVDDVIEVATYSALPVTGELGKIYIVVSDENSGGDTSSYRWTGSVYAMVSNTLTAADIKSLYESNTNTNAYTDAEKTTLNKINNTAVTSITFNADGTITIVTP